MDRLKKTFREKQLTLKMNEWMNEIQQNILIWRKA